MKKRRIIGMDAGSVMVSYVEIDLEGNLIRSEYRVHEGKPAETLIELLSSADLVDVAGAASTASTMDVMDGVKKYDNRVCTIASAKRFYPDMEAVLNVGGEKFFLTSFNEDGSYKSLKSNTSCAAGTGGFLDQQAKRLNLKDSAELSIKALSNTGDIPKIASRCSVFAKTDIIHSQQEGYSMEEICDGLCLGLAQNIADTLLEKENGYSNVVFCGGVARNEAVVKHLNKRLRRPLLVHPYSHLFGALGAAFLLLDEGLSELSGGYSKDSVHAPGEEEKEYFYAPLQLSLTDYPDFNGIEHYNFGPSNGMAEIEVDIYRELDSLGSSIPVYMGIDIGSTSTKAILIDEDFKPVAGLYTRTSGRPIPAVQSIFEAVTGIIRDKGIDFSFMGVGTTGSGRKFIGKLIGADLILDEISAHARAAVDLNPDVDTIIEIGGQDAKFTTLRNGVVTFSQMNTVCAAGTGSFIEEQALKLGVPLSEYSSRAEGSKAPLTSDRCTVYMERDINHFLNQNYSVNEILAAALYSVRENYLQKVATEGNIGNHVVFQGATAKNKALVAAFEQKLKKPVFVSKYCHLTGALGAAITASEERTGITTFKGLDIYREDIPVRSETCDLCLNHCRIRVATVNGEEVAYGFLCGRDYATKKYVKKEKVPSLIKMRKAAAGKLLSPDFDDSRVSYPQVVGLPAGLQVFEELPLWEKFFNELGIRTVSTEKMKSVISGGKEIAGAEFCAPMTAYYGHVRAAAEKSDIVFLPSYLENKKDRKNPRRLRKYCYYTQFSSVVTSTIEIDGNRIKSMRPVINYRNGSLQIKYELYRSVKEFFPDIKFSSVSSAYDSAVEHFGEIKSAMKSLYSAPAEGEVKVLLTGRPYTVLPESMNKGIPDFFAQLGVETVFQDSLPEIENSSPEVEKLLDLFHWTYASAIIEAADFCANTEGLYPVFVTSFKCSPDSFALEYFKRIMDSHEKPYLILQIDEHDSNVGYETRIEAGVRAFKNHLKSSVKLKEKKVHLSVAPEVNASLEGKTLLLPNWDPLVLPLVAANLKNAGIDARVLEETPRMIAASMKMNTGQCIPVNVIAHEYVQYIKNHGLDPAKTVLWMAKSGWACNIAMYPPFIKSLIEKEGIPDAGVYTGELTMVEISPIVSVKAYFAYMFGGNLKKIGCMIRPYEVNKGETDRVIEESARILEKAFLGEYGFLEAVKMVIAKIDAIPYRKTYRPKVAIFGDLYVRDNEIINQNLIQYIEDAGGEVLLTPYNEYAKIISGATFKRWIKKLNIPQVVLFKTLLGAMELLENRYHGYFEKYIGKPVSSKNPHIEEELAKFNIRIEQEGESYENILKIFRILKNHPDVSLFIQTNPAFCCPSLITEAMSREIEEVTGVPILTITYDGTESDKNDVILPYLKYAQLKQLKRDDTSESAIRVL